MYINHSSFCINFCCYSLSSCAPACWLFCYLLRGFLVPHVCLSSWQPLFVFHGPRSFTNIHLSYIHLMCVYFRFLWDAMCFLSSLMPYHPAHLRPWATTVFWTSSQSCSTNNMATLSMTVEVAGFQHGDGAIELSMYNVKYYI